METGLVSNLLNFLNEEKIKMELRKISDSEFWLESPDGFMAVKFVVDGGTHEILYDVFSPKYGVHLKEETVRDVEKLDFIAEEHRNWKLEKAVEDLWLVLDQIKLWAQKNKFGIKETEII